MYLNKYRLELHWDRVDSFEDNKVKLVGAYFSGPALKIAQKIRPNNKIVLDLSQMYRVFIPSYYLSKLEWGNLEYESDTKVVLYDAILEGVHLYRVPKLKNTDFFIIDTLKHEDKTHPFYLTYDAVVVNEHGEVYNF